MSKKNHKKQEKKLTEMDLAELRRRNQMINQYELVAASLRDSLQVWVNGKLTDYGFKGGSKCNISFEDGKIVEL